MTTTRAIERADQVAEADATGWLFRVTTRLCLDHLRRRNAEARVTALVDPLDMPELSAGEAREPSAEEILLLREDVRFAVVVALQRLSPRQRAVLVLSDVCDRPIEEIALSLGTTGRHHPPRRRSPRRRRHRPLRDVGWAHEA